MANGKLTPDREIDAEPERDVFLFSSSTEILEPRTVSAMDRHMGLFHMPAFRAVAAEAGGPSEATCTTGAAVLDANGDGRPDVVLATMKAPNVLLLNNIGEGQDVATIAASDFTRWTFPGSHAANTQNGQNAHCVVAFDADNDGDVDVFFGTTGTEYNQLWRNDGSGVFTLDTNYGSLQQHPEDVYAAVAMDANGDGWLDLYLVCGPRIDTESPDPDNVPNRLFLNDGAGNFVYHDSGDAELATPCSAAVALDIDLDGDLDLFVTTGGQGGNPSVDNAILINDGSGLFTLRESSEGTRTGYRSTDVKAADLDGDGDMDLIVTNRRQTSIKVENDLLINDGQGNFSHVSLCNEANDLSNRIKRSLCEFWSVTQSLPFDANGDGAEDILFLTHGNYGAILALNWGSTSTFTVANANDVSRLMARTYDAVTADFNSDGKDDLYVANLNLENELLLGDGSGRFKWAPDHIARESLEGRHTHTVGTADLNGDGLPDLYIVNFEQPNQIFLNAGGGSFVEVSGGVATDCPATPCARTHGVTIFDANGDGRPDIYVLEESPGSNSLFINTHMNTGSPVETDVGFTEETGGDIRAPTPSESQGKSMEAVAFDANGNGKMDLFVVNEVYYQLLTNDGDGHFETAFTSDDYTSLAQQKHVLRGALAFDVDNGKWANRSDPIPYVCVCALNRAALSHTLLMPDSCALL